MSDRHVPGADDGAEWSRAGCHVHLHNRVEPTGGDRSASATGRRSFAVTSEA